MARRRRSSLLDRDESSEGRSGWPASDGSDEVADMMEAGDLSAPCDDEDRRAGLGAR